MELDVDNVILYVADAVRHDAGSDRLATLGPTYKSVAASLHTPASVASLLTGQHVPHHGVTSFAGELDAGEFSIFDIPTHRVRRSDVPNMHHPFTNVNPDVEPEPLEEIEPPFIWLSRSPGGHAPYNGFDYDTYWFDDDDETAGEYFDRVIGDTDQLQADYQAGVDRSIDEFERLLGVIDDRGLAEDTLVIHTSDHGELLGEYGMVGHNHVPCPELAYVPTTFVHPSLEPTDCETLLRGVDILPTILEAIGHGAEGIGVDGSPVSALSETTRGYSHFETVFYNDSMDRVPLSYTARSVWGRDGGHAFIDAPYLSSLLLYAGLLLKSHKGKQIRADRAFRESFARLRPGHTVFGDPGFSRSVAESDIDAIGEGRETGHVDLGADRKEQLEDLGYM